MIQLLSSFTSVGYRRVVKPILFTQPPDAVHHRLVQMGGIIQRLPFVTELMHRSWAYRHPQLRQTLAGLTFENPVGLAAGFDKNFELAPLIKAVGFGSMEGGSVTLEAYAGNPRPWFYRLPKTKAIVVNAGLANQGASKVLARVASHPASLYRGFPLNISVAKTNSPTPCTTEAAIADYIGTLKMIQKLGVGQLITLNISCPNTFDGQPFTDAPRLTALLDAVDELGLKQPVFIKMPAHLAWPEFKKLVEVAAAHNVTGLTIANLIYRAQAELKDPLPDTVPGKIGGRPNFDISNALIRQTRERFGDRFVIIGVGGVFSAEDAYTKIKLGADLVQIITGLIYQGPAVVGQINRGLVRLLEADGYRSITEAVGADVPKPAQH